MGKGRSVQRCRQRAAVRDILIPTEINVGQFGSMPCHGDHDRAICYVLLQHRYRISSWLFVSLRGALLLQLCTRRGWPSFTDVSPPWVSPSAIKLYHGLEKSIGFIKWSGRCLRHHKPVMVGLQKQQPGGSSHWTGRAWDSIFPCSASGPAPQPQPRRGAELWPGQAGSWAGGGLWQCEFQALVKGCVVNETRTRAWKGQVWIQSCSAVLDKWMFGSVTKTLSISFVVVCILKEKYISAKICFHKS